MGQGGRDIVMNNPIGLQRLGEEHFPHRKSCFCYGRKREVVLSRQKQMFTVDQGSEAVLPDPCLQSLK